MATLSFTVLGVAAPQGSLRPILSKTTGRTFVKQSNPRTMPWRQEVAGVAASVSKFPNAQWPTKKPVVLRATFYLPRPKGHFGKKGLRPSAPQYPSKKPDLDKLARSVADALTGIVYADDSQIVSMGVGKVFDDGQGPRAVVEVEEMGA